MCQLEPTPKLAYDGSSCGRPVKRAARSFSACSRKLSAAAFHPSMKPYRSPPMSESMNSLYRRGAISSKQMGRMAKPGIFSKKGKRDQGGIKDRGEVPTNEINHPTNQKTGSPGLAGGLPSKGARINRGGQRTGGAI